MFLDYYAILEVDSNSDIDAIKTAFKKQALIWHPDRNPGTDTTKRMQQINEAYIILKDSEARKRYDLEYLRFKEYQQKTGGTRKADSGEKKQEKTGEGKSYQDNSYEIYDETLQGWMSGARKQAANLAKETLEDLVGMSKEGGKAITEAALGGIVRYFVFGIIMLIIIKSC